MTQMITGLSEYSANPTGGSVTQYSYNAQGFLDKVVDPMGKTEKYVEYDYYGNVTMMNDRNGNVKDYTYGAYGVQRAVNGDVYNPFRHNGEYYDDELGYTYLRNRYYDTSTGRFINEDPIKDGLNWYSYCGGNPVMSIDPSGLGPEAMLRYIVERKGGTVGWNDGTTTVTLNGITKSYSGLETINGRTIISAEKLAEDFGGNANDYIHDENDRFESADDAALAFSLTYYEYSLYANEGEGVEYSCAILELNENGNTLYFFAGVRKGEMKKASIAVIKPSNNIKQVAYAHTHGAPNQDYIDEQFSGTEFNQQSNSYEGDGYVAKTYGIDAYLMTPSKKFKKLDKSWTNVYLTDGGRVRQDPIEWIPNDSKFVTNFN